MTATDTGSFFGNQSLYCEVRGNGPVVVFVPGGNGDAQPYAGVAQALCDTYTTVIYDRRGFSRSNSAPVPANDAERFDTELADLDALCDHIGATQLRLFGSSSGAIIALHYLATRGDRVKQVVAHEPPLAGLLPDGEDWLAKLDEVHAIYETAGTADAMARFAEVTDINRSAPPQGAQLPQSMHEYIARVNENWPLFFERELRQYVRAVPDLETLDTVKDRIVLAGGNASRTTFAYQPNTVLAQRFDSAIVDFPGDHVGYALYHEPFATQLRKVFTD